MATRDRTSLISPDSGCPSSLARVAGARKRGSVAYLQARRRTTSREEKEIPPFHSDLSALSFLEKTCILSNIGYVTCTQDKTNQQKTVIAC